MRAGWEGEGGEEIEFQQHMWMRCMQGSGRGMVRPPVSDGQQGNTAAFSGVLCASCFRTHGKTRLFD